jgi:hypothetical protein
MKFFHRKHRRAPGIVPIFNPYNQNQRPPNIVGQPAWVWDPMYGRWSPSNLVAVAAPAVPAPVAVPLAPPITREDMSGIF